MSRPTRCLLFGLAALSLTAVACGGGGGGDAVGPPPTPPINGGTGVVAVVSVAVTPSAASVQAGSTVTLTAIPHDSAGNALTGRAVDWQTSDPNVAAVSSAGVVTGKSVGTVTITATSEGKPGAAAVTVVAVPVASVAVDPFSATVTQGATATLTASVKDAAGNALTGRTVNWQTSDANIATVSSTGLVTGTAVGTATITATSEGKQATAIITVVPVPVASVTVSPASATISFATTVAFTATVKDGSGNVLTGRAIAWSTADQTIATVSPDGHVTGQGAGTTTVTATTGGQTGTATVTVTKYPVTRVVVTPNPISLKVGASVALGFTLYDKDGNEVQGRAITLTINDLSIVTNQANVLTGKGAGSTTISVSSEGVTTTVNITVTP